MPPSCSKPEPPARERRRNCHHTKRLTPRGGRPPAFDAAAYKDRNAVERGFSHLKHHRALATRYDKLAVRYRATIHIASIDHWLKRLT